MFVPTPPNDAAPDSANTFSTAPSGSMNALTMFLFWFFLCSTAVLVAGSLAVLRRLKRREQQMRQDRKAAKKSEAKAATAATAATTATNTIKEMDEESSIGGSTASLVPIPVRAHMDTRRPETV